MSEQTRTHSREDIWSRVDSQSDAIAEIRAGQAHTDARLGALEAAVSDGLRSLATEIHGLAERVNAPKQQANPVTVLVTVLVGFVTILAMFGSFAFLINDPTDQNTRENALRITRLEEFDRDAHYNHGKQRGELEALKDRVKDIDLHGSRRWIDD